MRLVTVLGAGGMGRTRLALEAAAAQLDHYTHGVYFVSLAPLRSVEAILPTVSEAVGLTFFPGAEPRQQLLNYLRRKRMLLVLDNLEHLLEGVELATDILIAAPEIKILATSRTRLNVQDEHLYHIAGLGFPKEGAEPLPKTAETATRYGAVQLFVQSARRVRPGYQLAAGDLEHVIRICRLVQGMPLGILLAAAWIEMLTPEEVAAEMGQGLDFLESDLRDLPERQRSMRAVFDRSWNLLAEGERQVLQGVSVFRGGFTRQAAQQVTGASLRELMLLVDRSLLYRAPSGRYEIHELLRQYAAEKLDRWPEIREATRDRHSAFYTSALSQWGKDLQGARQRVAMAEIEADIDNAHAAWAWAVEQGRTAWMARAMDGACTFYSWHRRYEEGAAMCSAAATALEPGLRADRMPPQSRPSERVRARALAWQSHFAEQMGDLEAAGQLVDHSLSILDHLDLEAKSHAREGSGSPIDGRSERALALWTKAQCAWQEDIEQTRQLLEQSLALYRALDDRWWMGHILFHLSAVASWRGQYQKGEQLGRESLAISESLGDRWLHAALLGWLGKFAAYQGRIDEAERMTREALDELGGAVLWAGSNVTLDLVYFRSGRFAQARPGFERRAAFYDELGLHMRLVEATDDLVHCLIHLGLYEQADTLAQSNLRRCIEANYRLYTGRTSQRAALTALARKEPIIARHQLVESIRIFREIVGGPNLADSLAYLGYVEHSLGQQAEAVQHLCKALHLTLEGRFWRSLMHILLGVALVLADKGPRDRAVEVYALASRYPYVADSRWFEDVAGKHIAAVAATLPPDVVAAAQERGRAQDLWVAAEELLTELEG